MLYGALDAQQNVWIHGSTLLAKIFSPNNKSYQPSKQHHSMIHKACPKIQIRHQGI